MSVAYLRSTSKIQTRLIPAYYFVFEVMNTIFHYDLVLVSLNDKIIRYMFQASKKSNVFILF